MKHINGLYTQFNRAHNTDGALFRGRYKAVLVDADNYLLHVSRYIHRNPIETSISLVEDLVKYQWSSYPAFIKRVATPKWLVQDFIFSLQGKKHSADDVIAYLAKYFSVEVDDIVTVKKGRKEKNLPRWFAIKLCQDLTGLNLQALADVFKNYNLRSLEIV